MNDELRNLIRRFRSALHSLDDGPRIGDIRPGNAANACKIESWRQVLTECDGGRFGAIDLWSADELPAYQQTVLPVDNAADYLTVGQILYEPISIERKTETLHWLPLRASPVSLGTPQHFLRHFAFGIGYGEIIPDADDDPWWQFLRSQQGIS